MMPAARSKRLVLYFDHESVPSGITHSSAHAYRLQTTATRERARTNPQHNHGATLERADFRHLAGRLEELVEPFLKRHEVLQISRGRNPRSPRKKHC